MTVKRTWECFRLLTICAAMHLLLLFGTVVVAAQRDAESERPQKESKDPEGGAQKRRNLTVEVQIIESEKDKERRPGEQVRVHVQGIDDPRETNEKGQVRFSGVPAGPLSLQVMVVGVETCRLSGITVTEGDQLIGVLIDKSQKGKCTRLK
jgi:hypothetical protein